MVFGTIAAVAVTAMTTYGGGAFVSNITREESKEENQFLTNAEARDLRCSEVFAQVLKGWGVGGAGFGMGMLAGGFFTTMPVSLPASLAITLASSCLTLSGFYLEMGCPNCDAEQDTDILINEDNVPDIEFGIVKQ